MVTFQPSILADIAASTAVACVISHQLDTHLSVNFTAARAVSIFLSGEYTDPQLSAHWSSCLLLWEPGDLPDDRLSWSQQATVTHRAPKPASRPVSQRVGDHTDHYCYRFRAFWYFPPKDAFEEVDHFSELTLGVGFQIFPLVAVWEGEGEGDGQTCKEVTTVYSSAHTINPWARLCVPLKHTPLQVLLPSPRAGTEADGDYCGEEEKDKMESWSNSIKRDSAPPKCGGEQSWVLYRWLELWIMGASLLSQEAVSNGYIIIH